MYAVVRLDPAAAASVGRLPRGLPEASPTRLVALGGDLALVVADVPADAFGDDVAAARADDVAWLAERALRHEAVVEHVAVRVTTLPTKLFTVFSSPAAAAAALGVARGALDATFDRIDGAAEWGVRIVTSARAPERSAVRAAALRAKSGAAFLAARRGALHAAETTRKDSLVAARAAFDALARLARERVVVERRAPSPLPVWVDGALLVARTDEPKLAKAVLRARQDLARAGLALELSGPWPCYHFVAPPASRARGRA